MEALSGDQKLIYSVISASPNRIDFDTILEKTNLFVGDVVAYLMMLELDNLIVRVPGNAYKIKNIHTMTSRQVDLPDWVIARLQQNDPDLNKAITDMVTWVDKAKICMYQSDADLAKIIGELENSAPA